MTEVGETFQMRSFITFTIRQMINPRRMRWARNVTRMGRSGYRILLENPELKRSLRRPRRR
jgi:hypothetical protein